MDRLGTRGLLATGVAASWRRTSRSPSPRACPPWRRRGLWGLHMGLTQACWRDGGASAPPERLGTAFGVFNLACGAAMLWRACSPAPVAGPGPQSTFIAGAALAAAAIAVMRFAAR